jgi:hypothetical protein
VRRAEIEEQNRYLLRQQHDFRRAADIVTDALMTFEEVEAIAVIGSVAKALWKEIPPGSKSGMSARTLILRCGFHRSSGSRRSVAPGIPRCAGDMSAEMGQARQIIRSKSS